MSSQSFAQRARRATKCDSVHILTAIFSTISLDRTKNRADRICGRPLKRMPGIVRFSRYRQVLCRIGH